MTEYLHNVAAVSMIFTVAALFLVFMYLLTKLEFWLQDRMHSTLAFIVVWIPTGLMLIALISAFLTIYK